MDREHLEAYWAKNLSLIRNLLVVWAVVVRLPVGSSQ